MRMDDPTWSIRHEGESLFSIFCSLIKLIEGAFQAGLDEEKAIGVPVFTSYSASFTNILNDLVELMDSKDFENASKLFDACSLLKTNNSRIRENLVIHQTNTGTRSLASHLRMPSSWIMI